MKRLSNSVRKAMDLARSGALGRSFPSLTEMIEQSKGDKKRLARLISRNYNCHANEKEVRDYFALYGNN